MGIVAAVEGAVMAERWLQWIIAGATAVLALFWLQLASAPSPAMETDWGAPPVARVDAEPVALIEPPAMPERAEARIVAPPVRPGMAQPRADTRPPLAVVACAASVRKRGHRDRRRLCRRR
jgi:hypothetical protein